MEAECISRGVCDSLTEGVVEPSCAEKDIAEPSCVEEVWA